MVAASVAPTYVKRDTTAEGVVYWAAQWRATNYTAVASMNVDQELNDILEGGVATIDHFTVYHLTALANERSLVQIWKGNQNIGVIESGDTVDIYPFYGPFGPKPGPSTVGSALFAVTDAFTEWSGNCTTWLTAHGRVRPRQDATEAVPIASQPVDVKKIDVWPWKR